MLYNVLYSLFCTHLFSPFFPPFHILNVNVFLEVKIVLSAEERGLGHHVLREGDVVHTVAEGGTSSLYSINQSINVQNVYMYSILSVRSTCTSYMYMK